MKRKMIIMLIAVGILFGAIFLYKLVMSMLFKHYMATHKSPIVTVSAMRVGFSEWRPELTASGSLRAIRGVNVTSELAGMVKSIEFQPGATVVAGQLLVQLNADSDIGALNSLKAQADLARVNLIRDQAQYQIKAVSKATLDADIANLKSLRAQVTEQEAIVAKKSIRAPFSGRLGVSAVNPGQYVNPGDRVVNLQNLNPIWADFYMPQQTLRQLKIGLPVKIITDTYPDKIFTGKITTIDPAIDPSTRNVQVEATVDNPNYELVPGMFVTVTIDVGSPQKFLTLPQTAISFNPYGELVYLLKDGGTDDNTGKKFLIAQQTFVRTGETRGDQVTVLEGIKAGDLIVTSGQVKLKNGSRVSINNTIQPANEPAPNLPNEY